MPRPLIVIDSQSLFDWMVFRNPVCAKWESALGGVEWEWIFTSEMKAEFDFVAAKGFGERWPVDVGALAAAASLLTPVLILVFYTSAMLLARFLGPVLAQGRSYYPFMPIVSLATLGVLLLGLLM